ncbi:hypothetical protein [Weissella tructae]
MMTLTQLKNKERKAMLKQVHLILQRGNNDQDMRSRYVNLSDQFDAYFLRYGLEELEYPEGLMISREEYGNHGIEMLKYSVSVLGLYLQKLGPYTGVDLWDASEELRKRALTEVLETGRKESLAEILEIAEQIQQVERDENFINVDTLHELAEMIREYNLAYSKHGDGLLLASHVRSFIEVVEDKKDVGQIRYELIDAFPVTRQAVFEDYLNVIVRLIKDLQKTTLHAELSVTNNLYMDV